MEFISGTRVGLARDPDMSGSVEFPDPGQKAPDVSMVLVMWDGRSLPTWEYAEDLTTE
jgi:hypothetical protein